MTDKDTTDTNHWMIYYTNGEAPIAVEATDRSSARRIGRKTRDTRVSAAVREDEGAARDLEDVADDEFSTKADPYRFIEKHLNSSTGGMRSI